MGKLNLVLIGTGRIVAGVHLPNLSHITSVRLKACMDIRKKAADRAAELCKAEYSTTELSRVLEDREVDAVLKGKPMPLGAIEALRINVVLEAVKCSYESGEPVLIESLMRQFERRGT